MQTIEEAKQKICKREAVIDYKYVSNTETLSYVSEHAFYCIANQCMAWEFNTYKKYTEKDCFLCKGSGHDSCHTCLACDGSGKESEIVICTETGRCGLCK